MARRLSAAMLVRLLRRSAALLLCERHAQSLPLLPLSAIRQPARPVGRRNRPATPCRHAQSPPATPHPQPQKAPNRPHIHRKPAPTKPPKWYALKPRTTRKGVRRAVELEQASTCTPPCAYFSSTIRRYSIEDCLRTPMTPI